MQEIKRTFPEIHTRVCDISVEAQRIELYNWVTSEFPECNVLVNNAGIRQRVDIQNARAEWAYYRKEIASNLDAPVHLALLFTPHLIQRTNGVIINVSSGLAITPGAWVPIYSSTKAALHSFTVSLRVQLAETSVEVILPPAVNTDLGGAGLHTFGAPLNEFADSVFNELASGREEIGYGGTAERLSISALEAKELALKMYERVKNA